MNNLASMKKSVSKTLKKHSPEILMGIGIAGMIATTVLAVKATPKALILIEEEKNNPERENEPLTIIETVKTTWICYVPSAVTGSFSILCLISANSINARRNAALSAACTLSVSTLKDYRKKVVEMIGEKKEQTINDALAKEKIQKAPVINKEVIITGQGETLCFDTISGRYFRSNIDKLKKAEIKLNRQMIDEMDASLNDFYYEIGLEGISIGEELGWNINELIDLSFSSQLATDGTPCLVIDYLVPPKYGYRY